MLWCCYVKIVVWKRCANLMSCDVRVPSFPFRRNTHYAFHTSPEQRHSRTRFLGMNNPPVDPRAEHEHPAHTFNGDLLHQACVCVSACELALAIAFIRHMWSTIIALVYMFVPHGHARTDSHMRIPFKAIKSRLWLGVCVCCFPHARSKDNAGKRRTSSRGSSV